MAKTFNCTLVFEAKGKKSGWLIKTGAYKYFDILKMNKHEK